MFTENVFQTRPIIPATAKFVFVADYFVQDYVGGAELTTQALIDKCPAEYFCIHSKDVDVKHLEEGVDKFWIFGNFSNLDANLLPSVIANLKYSVLEYDYKYCQFRSPEKHAEHMKSPCDCHNQLNGKIISAFYYAATVLWWMSQKQLDRYITMFPFLAQKDNIVLSSVFDDATLGKIKALRLTQEKSLKKGWIVLGSNSWIKGAEKAVSWCKERNYEYEVVWNLSYDTVLEKLSKAEGFVYLPLGGDTCPRMVIEAKLLGCKLQLNDNVQHADEEWFATDDIESIEEYLYTAKNLFWNGIKSAIEYRPKISGYTTTRNCVEQKYPFEECIKSMLGFCDEVCIVDGGSTDGTLEKLACLKYPRMSLPLTGSSSPAIRILIDELVSQNFPDIFNDWESDKRIQIKVVKRDWSHPHFAVFDGMQKQEARALCTGDFCWQMDSDEIVHETDYDKIKDLCTKLPPGVDVLALPVVEYWGGPEKVRIDVQPWKWRLSRNKNNIGHGIPKELRREDENGLYAAEGTDGCDMIDLITYERLPHVTFHNEQSEQVRQAAMANVQGAREEYERWMNIIVENLPTVFHYSWYDLERKIRLYKNYWTAHWNSLTGKSTADTAEANMMFNHPWSEVTDDMIECLANELRDKIGGWIWHRKWDHKTITPHITVNKSEPLCMIENRGK